MTASLANYIESIHNPQKKPTKLTGKAKRNIDRNKASVKYMNSQKNHKV